MMLFEKKMGWLEVVIEKHSPQMPNRWAVEYPSSAEMIVDAGRFTFMLTKCRVGRTNASPHKHQRLKLILATLGILGFSVTANAAVQGAAPLVGRLLRGFAQ